jgi:hypothetical protein
LSAATKSRGRASTPAKITVTPGAAVTITRGGSDTRRGRRRLAAKTGTLKVLVVRVSTTNVTENPERSATQLASDCFGLGTPDTCSNGFTIRRLLGRAAQPRPSGQHQ